MKTTPFPSGVHAIRKQVSHRSEERFLTVCDCTSSAAIEQVPSLSPELKSMDSNAMKRPSGDQVLPNERPSVPERVTSNLSFPPSAVATTRCASRVAALNLTKAISLPSGENETGEPTSFKIFVSGPPIVGTR